MVKNALYPLKFRGIFKKTPWGGNRIERLFEKKVPPGGGIGESWEIADRSNDNSIITNGVYKDMSLHKLMDGPEASDMLGYEHRRKHRDENRFPLLVKLIDTSERLSLQVHPDDSYVRANEPPGDSGKMEAWYIIHTEP
ncbi:MAG: type I phosphomannose isomerase catalytic subunit, partial [Candidatus Brocadiales bacterium]